MKALSRLLMVGLCLIIVGCVGVRPVAQTPAEEPGVDVETRKQALQEAGAIVVTAESASLTQPMAENKALRRGREALAEAVEQRVEAVRAAFVEEADVSDPVAVRAWFEDVSRYLTALTWAGSKPALHRQEEQEGLFTVWLLMLESPESLLEAMQLRAANDRQLFALLQSSQAYQALEEEAERLKAYLQEHPL